MLTYATTLGKHNIALPDELIAEIEVPVFTGPQCQGDVGVFPITPTSGVLALDWKPVPGEGLSIVRGMNDHILDAYEGLVEWAWAPSGSSTTIGYLRVADGAVATLTHTDEHTTNGIGAGVYRVVGKREQAAEIRRVRD